MSLTAGLLAAYWSRWHARRLPDGYQEVEYVQASDTYVDTGLVTTVNDVYEIRAMKTPAKNTQGVIGDGAAKNDSNFAIWLADQTSTNAYSVEFSFGDGGSDAYKVAAAKDAYDVSAWHTYRAEVATGRGYVDGTLVGTASAVGSFANVKKLVFLGTWRGSSANSQFGGCVGELVVWRSGSKIRHLVPCYRKSDSTAGFYDLCGSSSPKTSTPFYIGNSSFKLSAGPAVRT